MTPIVIVSKRDVKRFDDAIRKQLPFAVARALTMTAAQARDEVRADLSKSFTLRNKFTVGSIRYKRAEKRDWPNSYSVVGSISAYLSQHEEGGTKQSGAKAGAIPKGIRRSDRSLVSRTKWPGKILPAGVKIPGGGRTKGATKGSRSKPMPFLLQERGGVGVYVRVGRRGRRLRRLYRLTKQPSRIKATHWLTGPTERVVRSRLASNFQTALEDALKG